MRCPGSLCQSPVPLLPLPPGIPLGRRPPMPLADLVIEKTPPDSRRHACEGPRERHLHEAAVMLAVTQWLFNAGAPTARMSPDGQHAKQFDIGGWLTAQGFVKIDGWGQTRVGGRYTRGPHTLEVDFKSGQGDVVADIDGDCVWVETKGGVLNTKHPGQTSKLRRGLCEAVGMLMNGSKTEGADLLLAAVPNHPVTETLAQQMAQRCRDAGIAIALVSDTGHLTLHPSMTARPSSVSSDPHST